MPMDAAGQVRNALKYIDPEPGWTKTNKKARIVRNHEAGDGRAFHSRAGARMASIAGLSLPVIGALLGHTEIATTQRTIVAPARLR